MNAIVAGIPRWSSIALLGNNRLLRTAYVWLIIVPLLTRIFSTTGSTVDLHIFGHMFRLNTVLPFSWKVFFYGALFTSTGHAIYALACPSLIKSYKSLIDFTSVGKGSTQLMQEYTTFLSRIFSSSKADDLQRNLESLYRECCEQDSKIEAFFTKSLDRTSEYDRWSLAITSSELKLKESKLGDAFWHVFQHLDSSYLILRILTCIFFLMAIVCFGHVTVQNIIFVISYQLSSQ